MIWPSFNQFPEVLNFGQLVDKVYKLNEHVELSEKVIFWNLIYLKTQFHKALFLWKPGLLSFTGTQVTKWI